MVVRAVVLSDEIHRSELRIRNDEVLRQSYPSQKSTDFSGKGLRRVEVSRKSSHIVGREECARSSSALNELLSLIRSNIVDAGKPSGCSIKMSSALPRSSALRFREVIRQISLCI